GQPGQDVLGFVRDLTPNTGTGSIVGSYNAGSGILTLTATAAELPSTWQLALRRVTYANTSDNPGNAPRTVSFTVHDGEAHNHQSNTVTRNIAVTPVNDLPFIQTLETTALNYTIGAAAKIVSTNVTARDLDDPKLVRATVTISTGYEFGKDVLG